MGVEVNKVASEHGWHFLHFPHAQCDLAVSRMIRCLPLAMTFKIVVFNFISPEQFKIS